MQNIFLDIESLYQSSDQKTSEQTLSPGSYLFSGTVKYTYEKTQ